MTAASAALIIASVVNVRLEDEGLVETALNRWTRVAPIDVGKAAEIYAIVEALELFALGTAIKRLTAQDVTRMREANQAMRRAAELQDPATAVIADWNDPPFPSFFARCLESRVNFNNLKRLDFLTP